jgi:hypothetical protein
MSRRCHHGSPRHAQLGRIPRRPTTMMPDRQPTTASTAAPVTRTATAPGAMDFVEPLDDIGPRAATESGDRVEPVEPVEAVEPVEPRARGVPAASAEGRDHVPQAPRPAPPRPIAARPALPAPPGAPRRATEGEDVAGERAATAPQLRRFIKSRAYVPMHELRRRFGINGGDDEVTPVDLERRRVFVGLPEREGRLLGELLRAGDIGYELSLDPISPIVVGVYPMRPVTRV